MKKHSKVKRIRTVPSEAKDTTEPIIAKARLWASLSVLRDKEMLMDSNTRDIYLKLTDGERKERIAKDRIEYLRFIVEKAHMRAEKPENMLKVINEQTRIGTFGENLASQMETILEDHPELSPDVTAFFQEYETMGDFASAMSEIPNIYQAAFSEVVEIVQGGSSDIIKIFDNLKVQTDEFNKNKDKIASATSQMLIQEQKIKENDVKLDEQNTIIDKHNETLKDVIGKIEDVRTERKEIELFIASNKTQRESIEEEITRLGRILKNLQAEGERLTNNPYNPNIQNPEIQKGESLKESISANITNSKADSTSPRVSGIKLLCRRRSCVNHIPHKGDWEYNGDSKTTAPCPRCQLKNDIKEQAVAYQEALKSVV